MAAQPLSASPIPGRWADDGLCNGHYQPDAWHPSKTGPLAPQHRAAVALCHQCPVETVCLEWAVEHGEAGIDLGRHHREGTPPHAPRPHRPPGQLRNTPGGYQSHVARNEWTCMDCRVAQRSSQAQKRAEAKASQ